MCARSGGYIYIYTSSYLKNNNREKDMSRLRGRTGYIYIYPVNMPDPIRKRFGYGQLWPLRPACSQNQAGSYMSGSTSRIRFRLLFLFLFYFIFLFYFSSQRRHDHIVQNRPGSDLDGLVRVWPNASGLEESR